MTMNLEAFLFVEGFKIVRPLLSSNHSRISECLRAGYNNDLETLFLKEPSRVDRKRTKPRSKSPVPYFLTGACCSLYLFSSVRQVARRAQPSPCFYDAIRGKNPSNAIRGNRSTHPGKFAESSRGALIAFGGQEVYVPDCKFPK